MTTKMARRLRRSILQIVLIGEVLIGVCVEVAIVKNKFVAPPTISAVSVAILFSFIVESLACAFIVRTTFREPTLLSRIGLGYFHCANLGMIVFNLFGGILSPFLDLSVVSSCVVVALRIAVCGGWLLLVYCRKRQNFLRRVLQIVSVCCGQALLADREFLLLMLLVALGVFAWVISIKMNMTTELIRNLLNLALAVSAMTLGWLALTSSRYAYFVVCSLISVTVASYVDSIMASLVPVERKD